MVGKQKRKSRITVRTFLNGRVLESQWVKRNRLLLLIIFVFLLFNIGVRYHSEKMIRQIAAHEKVIKELRSESLTVAAELMQMSLPTKVIERVEKSGLGLEVSKVPPRKLYVDKE